MSELLKAAQVRNKDLEKKIKKLERKLAEQIRENYRLQEFRDFSKERREKVVALAESLKEELNDAGWIDIDLYYNC